MSPSDSSLSLTRRAGPLNLKDLYNLVKYGFPRPASRDPDAVSLGEEMGKLHLEQHFCNPFQAVPPPSTGVEPGGR